MFAAHMGSSEAQLVAQEINEGQARFNGPGARRSIDGKGDGNLFCHVGHLSGTSLRCFQGPTHEYGGKVLAVAGGCVNVAFRINF